MIQINTNLELLTNGSTPTNQSTCAIAIAHAAAKELGFVIGVTVKFRNTDAIGVVTNFNSIRHQGMRATGDRAPLIITSNDGTIKEYSTGEVEIIK